MSDERSRVLAIIEAHHLKAAASAYDRKVCLTAVSVGPRDQIMNIPDDISDGQFLVDARKRIGALVDDYNDPDGEYTSGRSVLVPILDDLWAGK